MRRLLKPREILLLIGERCSHVKTGFRRSDSRSIALPTESVGSVGWCFDALSTLQQDVQSNSIRRMAPLRGERWFWFWSSRLETQSYPLSGYSFEPLQFVPSNHPGGVVEQNIANMGLPYISCINAHWHKVVGTLPQDL